MLVIFFAAAGASLQLDALAAIGWVAVGVSALRMGLIWSAAVQARAGRGSDRPWATWSGWAWCRRPA
jgi:hypothetical protein